MRCLCLRRQAHHADVVELCVPRGIHVMVEKPMAATLEQADRMLTAARKAGTVLMVNWPTAWESRHPHGLSPGARRRDWTGVATVVARWALWAG